MTTRCSTQAAAAACDALVDLLDAGAGPGYIEIRTGSQPATADSAATGTVLATLVLSDPAFGNATNASPSVATANSISTDAADATGTAGWFRGYDSTGTAVIDGNVTATGGGGDLELDSTAISVGGGVAVTSWQLLHGTG